MFKFYGHGRIVPAIGRMLLLVALLLALAGRTVPAGAQPAQTLPAGEIAYDRADNNNTNIWVHDLATGRDRQLTTDGQSTGPVWSPDGQRIAFFSGEPYELFIMNADGSQRRQLTQDQSYVWMLAFGPNGGLYFLGGSGEPAQPTLFYDALDGTPPTALPTPDLGVGICGPTGLSVSRSKQLALALWCGGPAHTILWIDSVTGRDGALDDHYPGFTANAYAATWAHGSERLAVLTTPTDDQLESSTIAVLDFAANPPQQMTVASGKHIVDLAWSGDDQQLVYTQGNPDTSPDLWVVDAHAGATPERVVTGGMRPAWRPIAGAGAPIPGMPATGQPAGGEWGGLLLALAALVLGAGSVLRRRARLG